MGSFIEKVLFEQGLREIRKRRPFKRGNNVNRAWRGKVHDVFGKCSMIW